MDEEIMNLVLLRSTLSAIISIADIEETRLVWLGKHPHYASSPDETINSLYDTSFEYLVEILDINTNSSIYKDISDLDKYISDLRTDDYDSEDALLNSEEWKRISNLAKIISIYIISSL